MAKKSKAYDNFYGRSWLLFHYLFTDAARRDQLVDYLTENCCGGAPCDASRPSTCEVSTA